MIKIGKQNLKNDGFIGFFESFKLESTPKAKMVERKATDLSI